MNFNTFCFSVIFFLNLCIVICGSVTSVAATFLGPHIFLKNYVAYLTIGSPERQYTLNVNTDSPDIIIYENLDDISVSFIDTLNGSDVILFGKQRFRIPIISDPLKLTQSSFSSLCTSCKGTFGISSSSFIWRLWTGISFSYGSIQFGSLNSAFTNSDKCIACLIECNFDFTHTIPFGSLCTTTGYYFDETIELSFSLDTPYTYLPDNIYNSYIMGKNIYTTLKSDWEPIIIVLTTPLSDTIKNAQQNLLSLGLDTKNCLKNYFVEINYDNIISDGSDGNPVLLLKPMSSLPINEILESGNSNLNNTIIFGNTFLNNYIVYRNVIDQVMVIQEHSTQEHIPTFPLLVLLLLFFYFVRWKMTDPSISLGYSDSKFKDKISIYFEASALVIITFVFFFGDIREILSDYPFVYTMTAISMILLAIIEVSIMIIAIATIHQNQKRFQLIQKQDDNILLKINITRNVVHEVLLLNAMWIILLESRSEGLSSIPSMLIHLVIIYILFFWAIISISCYVASISVYEAEILPEKNLKKNKKINQDTRSINPEFYVDKEKKQIIFLVFGLILIPVYLVFEIFIAYTYFIKPILDKYLQQFSPITGKVAVFMIVFIAFISIAMARLYIRKAIVIGIYEYKKEQLEKEQDIKTNLSIEKDLKKTTVNSKISLNNFLTEL